MRETRNVRTRPCLTIPLLVCLLIAAPWPAQLVAQASPTCVPPALPSIPDRTFDITKFGAVADNSTDNAKSIQAAIDAASAAKGGIVKFPAGIFLSGPIKLANQIGLFLDKDCTLKLLPIDRYPGGTRNPSNFIGGVDLHDIAITGDGAIEGQGEKWWSLVKGPEAQGFIRRPIMISIRNSSRILIEGVHLSNSPMFHIAVGGGSTDVTDRKVTIRAPASNAAVNPSHNTDACDVSGKHVLIDGCDVSVGDDDFTCGGGTSDVLIQNCKYGYGHGVSIGSPTRGGVSNLRVINCTFDNTESGIRIKSDRDRGGDISNIEYRNLTMHNVGMPILIYGSYNSKVKAFRQLNDLTGEIAATYPSARVTPLTPIYHNITFSDITATTRAGSRPGLIWGLPEAPVSNLTMSRVKITGDGTFGIFNASKVHLEQCSFTTRDGKDALSTAKVSDLVTQP